MLPFKDGSFDLVFALSAMEHFSELNHVVSEIIRVLRPGGRLVFLSPTENLFYRIGRRVLGYVKPEDHYHSGSAIEKILSRRLRPDTIRNWPFGASPLFSMYRIAIFEKGDSGMKRI